MRRLALCLSALVLGVVPALVALPAVAAPTLPAGFTMVDYPTGQAPYDLTNFAWVGNGDLLTTGKDGAVTFVPHRGSPRTLTTVPQVRAVDDHGLLGLALAPDYATSGRVYLSYDKGDPDGTGYGMLEEWRAVPAADPTNLVKVRAVVDGHAMSPRLTETTAVHGPDSVVVAGDGTLFWSVGDDAQNNGDPQTLRAQDLDQPYGKVLHVTAAGAAVKTNPFYAVGAPRSWRSMVYASGLRNPFRFAVDPRSRVLHLGDVGWGTVEELDSLAPGANLGWPCYEGNLRTTFSAYPRCQALYKAGDAVPPVWTYPHAGAGAAVVAGDFYTGTSYPAAYRGSFFLGDYSRGWLWTLVTRPGGTVTRRPEAAGFARDVGAPVAFHPGPNGDITFADLVSGQVRRLVYAAGNRRPVAAIASKNDPATRTVTLSGSGSYDLDQDQLTYAWTFGDGTTASGETVTHRYADADAAQVRLTVRDQLGATGVATTTVHPANHTPVLTLRAPPAGTTYAVGETVALSATASDVEDGARRVSWQTVLLHCPFAGSCHVHPDGVRTGPTYTEGFTDHGADTIMVITASATDSTGATTSAVFDARPDLHTVAVDSPVPVDINGETVTSAQVVSGAPVHVVAPRWSSYLRFSSWSDGGAAAHAFPMPDRDVTLTAAYRSAIEVEYAALGGSRSFLGKPAGPEQAVAGGRGRSYAGGRILWSPATGAHEVHGSMLTAFEAAGGTAVAGFPTGDEHKVKGGRAAYFTRARIYRSKGGGTHLLQGAVLAKYRQAGGPDRYGLPRTGVVSTVGGGSWAAFTGGRRIYHSGRTGSHLVYGSIRKKYGSLGYERSCLGFPTTDEYAVQGGRRSRFEGGRITWVSKQHKAKVEC